MTSTPPVRFAKKSLRPVSIAFLRSLNVAWLALLTFAILVAGIAAAILPFWIVIAFVLAPAFVMLVYMRREYGLLAVVALASGLVHPSFTPSLGPLKASDMAMGTMLLLAIASRLRQNHRGNSGVAEISFPFWVFVALTTLSVIYAIVLLRVDAMATLGEARDLGYLLLLPATVWTARDDASVVRLSRGIVVLGCLFAIGQLVQGLLDIPLFGYSGRLETLETLGRHEFGVTRTLTQGIGVIEMALFLIAGRYLLGIDNPFKLAAVFLLLLSGILLTFGRTTFAVSLFGLLVVAWLTNPRRSLPFFVLTTIGLFVALGALSIVRPAFVEGFVYRVTGIQNEIASGSSANWRYYEAQVVLPQIKAHPFAGIGLGADYRAQSASDVQPEQTRYIHDAYLYMADKMGLPALAVFLWFLAALAIRAWKAARSGNSIHRPLHAAGAASLVGMLAASVTEPHFMSAYSLSLIALTGGLVIAASRPRSGSDNLPRPIR